MSFDPRGAERAELDKNTQDLIRFLIKDSAFDVEFLLTAIQEYYHHNTPEEKGRSTKQ